MNAKFYRCRPWPLAPSALVVLTWCDTSRPREVLIEWYLVLDALQKGAVGQRFRVSVDPANPNGPEGLEAWLQQAERFALAAVQVRVDEAWMTKGLMGFPPLVGFEAVDASALLGLRLRGGGEGGLRALAELVRDPETREYAGKLLHVSPLVVEDIPAQ